MLNLKTFCTQSINQKKASAREAFLVYWSGRQDLLAKLALRVVLKDAQDSFAILVNRLRNKRRLLLNLKTFCTQSINQKKASAREAFLVYWSGRQDLNLRPLHPQYWD
ncbi:hypothetical protein N9M91_02080 [Porticoccaceae bacterium]|nr:hypothetical protein [Porticoccaceae bacterium]